MAHIAILSANPIPVNNLKAGLHVSRLREQAFRELGHRVTYIATWDPEVTVNDVRAVYPVDDLRRIEPTKEESETYDSDMLLLTKHCPAGAARTMASVIPDVAVLKGLDVIGAMRGKLECPTIGIMSIPEWKLIPWRLRTALAHPDLGILDRYRSTRDYGRYYFQNRRRFQELGEVIDIALTPDQATVELFDFTGRLGCRYLPAPVADLVGTDGWARKRERTILMVNAQGTHSDSANLFFSRHIAPALEKAGGLDFRLEIVGRKELPPFVHLPPSLSKHTVIKPFIPEIEGRLKEVAALLMCSPIPIGASHRIKIAMMCGTVPIIHEAVTRGFPDLVHGKNCLIARKGSEFVEHIRNVLNDDQFRTDLSRRARETYEHEFTPERAKGMWRQVLLEVGIR